MTREKNATIILRVPDWMKEQLKEHAGGEELSNMIRELLRNFLIEKGKEKKA